MGAKTYEKHIALSLVLKLGKMIEERYPEMKVVYTRKTDTYPELKDRSRIANEAKADLFISVHTNSVDPKKTDPNRVRGVETLVLGTFKPNQNLDAAIRENSVIRYENDSSAKYASFDPSKPESYIIFNFVKSLHLKKSLEIASVIQEELVKGTQLPDREVHQQPLFVLMDVAMPSTLVEVGFISNPQDERFMMSQAGQDKIVKSIFRGFVKYKNKIEKNVGTPLNEEDDLPVPANELAQRQEEQNANDKVVAKVSEKTNGKPEEKKKVENKTLEKPQREELPTKAESVPFYAVQVASAGAKIKNASSLCAGEKVCELYTGGRYRYYVVQSEDFDEVKRNLQKIKNKVRDCFIIAVHKGNLISVAEARKLEGIK